MIKKYISIILLTFCFLSYSFSQEKKPRERDLIRLKKLLEFAAIQIKSIKCYAYSTTIMYGKERRKKIRIFGKQPNKIRIEYLEPKSMKGRFIIIKGDILWRYIPVLKKAHKIDLKKKRVKDEKTVATPLDKEFGFIFQLIQRNPETFYKNFDLKILGFDTINKRKTYIVEILPKQKKEVQPRQIIWVDKRSGLILKVEFSFLETKEILEFFDIKTNVELKDELFEYKGKVINVK